MRTFDVIGALAVTAWLVVSGLYVYRHEFQSHNDGRSLDSEVALSEGETWLLLRRNDEEIGYIHRTNTRLEDGWLLEYEMLLLVGLLDQKFPVDTTVKSTLDTEARLRSFDAEIEAAGRKLAAQGEVDGSAVSLVVNAGSSPRRQTIELKEPPRLASSSVQQLVARRDLEPGDTFENEYFDPTAMGMTTIVMEYVGREEIDVFGETHRALHVRQTVSGQKFDVYLDEQGEMLIQEFPMDIVGARVAPELGRTRASAIRKEVNSLDRANRKAGGWATGTGVSTALDMLGVGAPAKLEPAAPDAGDAAPDAGPPDSSTPTQDTHAP